MMMTEKLYDESVLTFVNFISLDKGARLKKTDQEK